MSTLILVVAVELSPENRQDRTRPGLACLYLVQSIHSSLGDVIYSLEVHLTETSLILSSSHLGLHFPLFAS